MKKYFLALLLTLVPMSTHSAPSTVTAGSYVVIVNPSNPVSSLSRSTAARMFLKKSKKWDDGRTVQPVDLFSSSSTRASFSRGVLKKSVSAVKAYWQKQVFTGRGVPPPEKSSEYAVISYVRSHRGAIGYVSAGAASDKVKVISID